MDGANLKQVTKNLKELIKQIGQYNEEYKNMDAETKASFTKVLNVNNESQDKSSSLLNQLNSTNTLILDELKKQTKGGKAMTNAISGAA
jgi:phosphoribosylanthranilate isomerase